MHQTTALYEPVTEVRDVLESFLVNRILLSDWQQALRGAAARFTALGAQWHNERVADLGSRVETLAERGLETQDTLARSVAAEVAAFLDEARVPGIPRPEDEDLAF